MYLKLARIKTHCFTSKKTSNQFYLGRCPVNEKERMYNTNWLSKTRLFIFLVVSIIFFFFFWQSVKFIQIFAHVFSYRACSYFLNFFLFFYYLQVSCLHKFEKTYSEEALEKLIQHLHFYYNSQYTIFEKHALLRIVKDNQTIL